MVMMKESWQRFDRLTMLWYEQWIPFVCCHLHHFEQTKKKFQMKNCQWEIAALTKNCRPTKETTNIG